MKFLLTLLACLPFAVLSSELHFDDLCEGVQHPVTVHFKEIRAGHCVCFGTGTYDYHESSPPSCSSGERFHVPKPTCVALPTFVKSVSRLSLESDFAQAHVNVHFGACNRVSSRVKRDAADETPVDATDEDFISAGEEIGHDLMRAQMNQYIETVIAKLTGLQGEGGQGGTTTRHKYPVIKLLDYTKQIMQRTCAVVNPDFFDLALNSFVNLQLETYHLREPYLGYSAFKRIELAMTRCLQKASPHVFITDEVNATDGTRCESHLPTKTSDTLVLHSGTSEEEFKTISIPPYASSELEPGKIVEPLVESVWKMLVSAHSYCYMYFSDYFNDHHTYTVSLLPLFTNEIQDIWLNENGTGYDLSDPEKTKLYGNLLGDVLQVMKNVDSCTGASRAVSPYPWFMNRPLRDMTNGWNKRRKREVDEVEFVNGRVAGEGGVLRHECIPYKCD